MSATIQLKRAENTIWNTTQKDYIPARGEPCVAFNAGPSGVPMVKIGDGVSTFAQLPFLESHDAESIQYNNILSGLKATNLQDAIDEIANLEKSQQIKSIYDLDISTSHFNTLEKLLKKILETPTGKVSSNDKIIGDAPITIRILPANDDENQAIETEFIDDGKIELTILEMDSFSIKFMANLKSQKFYPYSWSIVDAYNSEDGRKLYWRSPVQNIDGGNAL